MAHAKTTHSAPRYEYSYAEPVSFGSHRMMFRPRDSHSIRLLDTRLSITPTPSKITWLYDAFGNSVAVAYFGDQRSASLTFESEILIKHYETPQPTSLLTEQAKAYPFGYSCDELPDLDQPSIPNTPIRRASSNVGREILLTWKLRYVAHS